MEESVYFSFVLVLVLGAAAQWMGWRFQIPSILILLIAGFLVGPVTGVFQPDQVFGHLLFPAVSAAVAIILFEGGLTLRFRDLKGAGVVIFRLVIIGVLVTWFAASYFAYALLGFEPMLSLLFGALLSVTGPTVIGPMLRMIRPKGKVKNIAKWEGILIDPVGVLIAVLVFEVYIHSDYDHASSVMLMGIVKTIVIGVVGAGVTAGILIFAMKAKLVPDFLQNLIVLAFVIASFGISNVLQEESGLLTVTLLGVILANQRIFNITHILHFKENLRVLLISSLFIVLAARVEIQTIRLIDFNSLLFLIVLILLVRPLSVILSTVGSQTNWRERALLMMLAPRGIVAASLTSVFALKLMENGVEQANQLLAETLLVIVGTVLFYGLLAGRVAARLKLSNLNPEGLLIIGAHSWARDLGKKLREAGAHVSFIDTNRHHIGRARTDEFEAHCGSVLSDEFLEEMDLSEIGHAVAITQNNEVNTFAKTTLKEFIESADIYQLSPEEQGVNDSAKQSDKTLNPLFDESATYNYISKQLGQGAKFRTKVLEDDFDIVHLEEKANSKLVPLFGVRESGEVKIFTAKSEVSLAAGSSLVFMEVPQTES